MPESKVRDEAAKKKVAKDKVKVAEARAEKQASAHAAKSIEGKSTKTSKPKQKKFVAMGRDWVPWVFVPMALLGVIWLLLFYIAGNRIPVMQDLRNWNYLIGIGLIAASFGVATLWK